MKKRSDDFKIRFSKGFIISMVLFSILSASYYFREQLRPHIFKFIALNSINSSKCHLNRYRKYESPNGKYTLYSSRRKYYFRELDPITICRYSFVDNGGRVRWKRRIPDYFPPTVANSGTTAIMTKANRLAIMDVNGKTLGKYILPPDQGFLFSPQSRFGVINQEIEFDSSGLFLYAICSKVERKELVGRTRNSKKEINYVYHAYKYPILKVLNLHGGVVLEREFPDAPGMEPMIKVFKDNRIGVYCFDYYFLYILMSSGELLSEVKIRKLDRYFCYIIYDGAVYYFEKEELIRITLNSGEMDRDVKFSYLTNLLQNENDPLKRENLSTMVMEYLIINRISISPTRITDQEYLVSLKYEGERVNFTLPSPYLMREMMRQNKHRWEYLNKYFKIIKK